MRSLRCQNCRRVSYSAARPQLVTGCPHCRGPVEAMTDVWEDFDDPRFVKLPPVLCALPGSYRPTEQSYPSLREFVKAKRGRAPSAEVDFGLRWLDDEGHGYRAAWVVDTRELILVQWGKAREGAGHVEVLALVEGQDELDDALSGWQRVCGTPGSLEWLRSRVADNLFPPT